MPNWNRAACLSYRDDDGKIVFWPVKLVDEDGGKFKLDPKEPIIKDWVYTKARGPEGSGEFGTHSNDIKAKEAFETWLEERSYLKPEERKTEKDLKAEVDKKLRSLSPARRRKILRSILA